VADKIDREILQGTEDLYNELGKFEHLVRKNKYDKKNTLYSDTKSKQQTEEKNHAESVLMRKKGNGTILRKIAGLKRETKD